MTIRYSKYYEYDMRLSVAADDQISCLNVSSLELIHRPARARHAMVEMFAAKFARWHRSMLEKGFYLAPSMYEAGFMSLAHTEEDIDRTIAAAKEVMATL